MVVAKLRPDKTAEDEPGDLDSEMDDDDLMPNLETVSSVVDNSKSSATEGLPAELAASPVNVSAMDIAAALAAELAARHVAEPADHPAAELTAQPAANLTVEPTADFAANPTVDLAANPTVDLDVKPVVHPQTTPTTVNTDSSIIPVCANNTPTVAEILNITIQTNGETVPKEEEKGGEAVLQGRLSPLLLPETCASVPAALLARLAVNEQPPSSLFLDHEAVEGFIEDSYCGYGSLKPGTATSSHHQPLLPSLSLGSMEPEESLVVGLVSGKNVWSQTV